MNTLEELKDRHGDVIGHWNNGPKPLYAFENEGFLTAVIFADGAELVLQKQVKLTQLQHFLGPRSGQLEFFYQFCEAVAFFGAATGNRMLTIEAKQEDVCR